MEEYLTYSKKPQEITVESVKAVCGGSSIDNDVLLMDNFADKIQLERAKNVSCLLFALCLQGECRYVVDTVEHVVHAGDIVIVGRGQMLSGIATKPGFKGLAMAMSYEFYNTTVNAVHSLSTLFLFAKRHPVYRLTDEEVASINEYYHIMRRKADDGEHKFRRETVKAFFNAMLCDLGNAMYRIQVRDTASSRAEKIFIDFITLVEQHFRHERRVAWYGQQLCLSPKYLSEMVKSVSGRTPNEWIDHYVTMELRVMLRDTASSVKEIAHTMNFSSQSFMGKYFKERTGLSPLQYRKQMP